MTEQEAIETVAAGTGIVIVPMSVARLHHRKDVVHRVVTDLPPTTIALVWLRDRDDETPRPSWAWSRAGPPTRPAADGSGARAGP